MPTDTRRRAPQGVQRIAHAVHNGVIRVRNLGNRAVSGDKPLIVAFLLAFVAAIVLLSGPMQSYMASSERVDLLEAQRAALHDANAALEQRAADLQDPAQLELRARQDGYIRLGEVPYVVVAPEPELPELADVVAPEEPAQRPWYGRLWRGLTSLFGG